MATGTRFNAFALALAQKKHNLGSDTLKLALSNTAPNVTTNAVYADITPIAAGNGYPAGGYTLPSATLTQVTAGFRLTGADTAGLVAASGGDIGPFRYVVLYNDTAANKDLIETWDLGSAITVTDGTSRDLNLTDANNAVLTCS